MLQLPESFRAEKQKQPETSEAPDRLREEGLLCGRPRSPERVAPKEKEKPTETTEKLSETAACEKKHGLSIETKDGKYVFTLKVKGEDKILLSTDATPKGIEKAEQEITKLTGEKQSELEKIFKVSFATDGENVLNQWIQKDDCSWEKGGMIKSRLPNLAELNGIEAALYKAQPSHLVDGGKHGIKFYFLIANYYKDSPALAYFVRQDKNNNAAIYYEPGANVGKPITEKDADRINLHKLYSIEAVTHHELMHNAQNNMGWDTPKVKDAWARKVGWLPFEDPKTHDTKWIFKGKKDEHFRRDQDHCKDEFAWCACSKHGSLENAGGNSVSQVKDAQQHTLDQVRDLAQIKPATRYFTNPLEMFAEGGMKYRVNEKRREELLFDSPILYEAVKEHDQNEMNVHYGKDSTGSPNYIRTITGEPVKNNAEARKVIADFEDRVKKMEKKK